jgi:hypothetical protein
VKLKAGVTAEVPELVAFIAENTGDPAPDNALYVGVYEPGVGETELFGCLIFYSPFKEEGRSGVKFGGALAPGKEWGSGLSTFIELRNVISEIVFGGLRCDFLQADVKECNTRTMRLLSAAGFVPSFQCGDVVSYRYSP